MSIADKRAAAVARRKAAGVPINKFMKDGINMSPEHYSLEEFKYFCKEREAVRAGLPTDDFIIKNNKFTNIFRDDDKTTKFIFKYSNGTFEDLFYSRLINRVDWLDVYYRQGEVSLEGKAFTNLLAYQLQPGIGWKYGYDTIKEAIVSGDIRKDLPAVQEAVDNASTLEEAVEAGNKAFGGYIKFVLFQVVLDYWTLNCDERLHTTPHCGEGSKPALAAMGMSLEDLREELQPQFTRQLHLFDVEHALCEYRKYVYQKQRVADGKKLSKPYKPNSMGVQHEDTLFD